LYGNIAAERPHGNDRAAIAERSMDAVSVRSVTPLIAAAIDVAADGQR